MPIMDTKIVRDLVSKTEPSILTDTMVECADYIDELKKEMYVLKIKNNQYEEGLKKAREQVGKNEYIEEIEWTMSVALGEISIEDLNESTE
jgi:hypothetical protein